MSLNDRSPIAAGLSIPTVPVVLSQTPKPRTRICSQCGSVLPQNFPWTACDDCQSHITRLRMDVPAPGRTLRVNQDMANSGQSGQIFSTCVSCLMAVEVPRINPPLHRDLVCTACRMQQKGTKLKPTRCTNQMGTTKRPSPSPPYSNAFPDITPIRGPPYLSFFNSRGELAVPPPVTVPASVNEPFPYPNSTHDWRQTIIPHVMPAAPVRVCMRYGCGVRLGRNQLFNACDECLRLGFGRGPPSLGEHPSKRVKRDELPSAALISKVKRDIEIAQKLQPPRQRSLEPGAGNEDLDLELVYPEDEELAVQNCEDSAAKEADNAISLPESTLEPGSSQISPLTLTTSTPGPRPSKRMCETPGCGGTVSSSAAWQRCYKCSLQRWKERQHAAIAASAIVGPVSPAVNKRECTSTSGEATDVSASPEANIVDQILMSSGPAAVSSHSQAAILNDLDNLSLPELPDGGVTDYGEAARPSCIPNTACGSSSVELESTKVILSGWDNDLTSFSSEEEGIAEGDSDSDVEGSSMIKIRIPVLVSRLPSGANARVCAIKRCNIVLPPDYRWKICDSCRRYQRGYQRIRMEKARRRMEEFTGREQESDSRKPEAHLLEVQNNEKTPEGLRLCAVPRCHARLPESNYRWKCCRACRTRARDDARRSSVGNLIDLEDPVERSSSSNISPYPTFQNLDVLLSEFSAMLGRFVEAQILYLRMKLQTAGEKALSRLDPVLFAFDGEYSTVIGQRGHQDIDGRGQFDPEKSQEAGMQKEAASVVEELNGALLAEFKPSESFMVQSGGVVARYNCALELIVPLRPLLKTKDTGATMSPESDTSSSQVPYMKPMSGELEVAVVPDDSHRLLLGRRTVIRFRMLG